jgi:hypothetical protein
MPQPAWVRRSVPKRRPEELVVVDVDQGHPIGPLVDHAAQDVAPRCPVIAPCEVRDLGSAWRDLHGDVLVVGGERLRRSDAGVETVEDLPVGHPVNLGPEPEVRGADGPVLVGDDGAIVPRVIATSSSVATCGRLSRIGALRYFVISRDLEGVGAAQTSREGRKKKLSWAACAAS